MKNNVIKKLDHSLIQEDVEWFEGKQPSTENLVLFIWENVSNLVVYAEEYTPTACFVC